MVDLPFPRTLEVVKWLAWIVGVIAFLAMLYACALPGDLAVGRDEPSGLAGTYTVNGVDATGVEYSGTVVITTTDRSNTFDMEWIITGAILRGTGVRKGDTLVADWSVVSSATAGSGRTTYRIEPDGRLVGDRQVEGFDDVGSEEIFPDA